MSNFLPGLWQIVDFRLAGHEGNEGPGMAIWREPPVHVTDGSWVVLYMSPALVIASTSHSGELCFFIHQSLLEGLKGPLS